MKIAENRRILIIDDEPEIRDAYRVFLNPSKPDRIASSRLPSSVASEPSREQAFEVIEAESGDQALAVFERDLAEGRRFAGAIVDVRMPGQIDGLQFIQRAWAKDPDLMIVVATAYQDRSVDEIDRMFGSERQDQWDYLTKPFTSGEIRQKARQLVSSWNRRSRERAYTRKIQEQHEALLKQEQVAVVGKFAHVVGHELGNVLQQVITGLELMPPSPQLEETIEACELGSHICQDLLTFARHQRDSVAPKPVPLKSTIDRALRLLRHALRRKDIAVSEKVAPDVLVVCHEARLVQVFVNLINNAIYAMEDGGKLEIGVERKGKTAVIEVRDDGSGIPPDDLKRLFEPLFSTKGEGGTGLGLTVCRSIAESYGGQIEIESQVGKGTTARVTFPC